MTREKAIKLIGGMKSDLSDFYDYDDLTALDMAISALSAEGEYIKKEDALFKKWQFKFKDVDGEHWFVNVKDIESLPTYSFPDREKGEWIPVSERLPKAFETVLRTRVENGWNGTTYTIVDTGCICPADYNVVAWMPLPEPYKAERGE